MLFGNAPIIREYAGFEEIQENGEDGADVQKSRASSISGAFLRISPRQLASLLI